MHLHARRILLPAAVLVAALPIAFADVTEASPAQPVIASAVVATLQTRHLTHRAVDDALSEAWFDAYLKALDPAHMYFLKSDIDAFLPWRDRLDDDIQAAAPKLEAAFTIHHKLMQRLRERVAYAHKLLAANRFDFSDPSRSVETDREDDAWAASTAELDARWDDYVAQEVLRFELTGDARERAIERVAKRFDRILSDMTQLDEQDVLESYLGALAGEYDPHSVWFKPIEKQTFDIEMRDTLTGIGAELNVDEDGYTTIKGLIPGGPAEASGELEAGDRIVAVAQGHDEAVDVVDMRLDNVVQLIRGPIDTTVVLTIYPAGATDPSETRDIELVRDKVKLAKAQAKGEVHEKSGVKVGVIDVPSFYVDNDARRAGDPNWASTSRDVARILTDFRNQGVDAVIVDLRNDGGGSLDEAIGLTGLFLDGGPVVQIKDSFGQVEVLADEDPTVAWSGPLVVLTNELSASASEIFAGAIQDYKRGIVVGSKTTHGKGSVQNLMDLDRLLDRAGRRDVADQAGAIKFTTHMFFRPGGDSTQGKGVAADVVLPSPYQGLPIMEADLHNPLPFARIDKAKFAQDPLPLDLDRLRKQSATRVGESMQFAFLAEDLAERERLQAQKTLSLDEATRRAERTRNETIRDNHDKAYTAAGMDPEHLPDFILDEAIAITHDVVMQLQGT
ncbi:MAG: carboxy terminal-processing peptidase [Alphaproteobacteria bacterium]|nr:carboxy terminal-processing peptidase [Alphaproteobacteria bacterium]